MTRFLGVLLVGFLCCAAGVAAAQPAPAVVLDCVQQPTTGGSCGSELRTYPGGVATGNYVMTGGFFARNDSGGGLFQAGADDSCATITTTTTASGVSKNSNTIMLHLLVVGIQPGMSITSATASGTMGAIIFPYDIITNVSGTTLTLETPVVQTVSSAVTLTIGRDNGGSVIADAETTPGPRCFYRSSSQYTPKEWGAYEDRSTDDTVALQSWLYTGQSFITGVNRSHLAVAGPHGQPAVSIVSFPLTCPADTTIQGPANVSGINDTPLFVIRATKTGAFPSGSAVINAYDHCRISGVGIDGSHVADAVDIYGPRVTIDGYSALLNGNPHNLDCGEHGKGNGLLIVKDSELRASDSDNIYMPHSCPNVRLIGDIIQLAGNGVSGSTANGIVFGGIDLTLADGTVLQSAGNGLDLEGASKVSVTGMNFPGNGTGTTSGGAGMRIANSHTVAVSGNHFNGNGYSTSTGSVTSAHVYFSGASVGVSFSGNAYDSGGGLHNPATEYVYAADPGTSLTASGFYENPPTQALGVVAPSAETLIPPFQVLP